MSSSFDRMQKRLGFGFMRLPMIGEDVDIPQTSRMVDIFLESGFNYFDTARPYHGGFSEKVLKTCLADRYDRSAFLLADKLSTVCFQNGESIRDLVEDQLKTCGVEYFDYYLLHNVYENSMHIYTDEKIGVMEYFRQQKRLGKIKHLGFSSHGRLDNLKEFLDL